MPIGSILSQPAASSINAAYRPVILRVSATATNGDQIPPVVFCDIYFAAIFYKTISRTQYSALGGSGDSEWEFDIQDACQEFLSMYIAANGASTIKEAAVLVSRVTCKFRSSGIDTDGFTVAEGTPPIQGTVDEEPTAGTGTNSNDFYVVNATLQHEDNQDLAAHLNSFKNGTWGGTTWPLSHRPNHYKLCTLDSDFFPILSDLVPDALSITYTPVGGGVPVTVGPTSVSVDEDDTDDGGSACSPVGGSLSLPNAISGVAYSASLALSGDGPFVIEDFTGPAWMSANIVGNSVQFTGTPEEADEGTGIAVSVDVSNCAGSNTETFSTNINVVANFRVSASFGMSIDSVTGAGAPAVGSTGTNGTSTGHQSGMGGTMSIVVTGTPGLTLSMNVTVNGVVPPGPNHCVAIPSAGTYNLDVTALTGQIVAIAIFSGTC